MRNNDLTESEVIDLYNSNKEFSEYVNKYCVNNHIDDLNKAFKHKMVNYAAQNILGILKVGDSPYV